MFNYVIFYSLLLFCSIAAFIYRKRVIGAFITVPVILSLYFWISCIIFEFGFVVPILTISDDKTQYLQAINSFTFYFVGVFFAALPFKSFRRLIAVSKFFSISNNSELQVAEKGARYLLLAVFLLVAVSYALVLFDVPMLDLIYRKKTFVYVSPEKMSLIDIMFWVVSILIAFIRDHNSRRFLLLLYFSLYLSLGERQAFLLLVLYFFIRWAYFSISLSRFLIGQITALITLVALIGVRYNEREAGLVGLGFFVFSKDFLFYWLLSINYITNFSFITSGNSIAKFSSDFSLILYSFNPLPSSLVVDKTYVNGLDLQPHVPYSGLAMLYNSFGYIGTFVVGSLCAALVGIAEILVRRKFHPIFLLVLLMVLIVFSGQYNLRAGVRFFYYMMFFGFLYSLFSRFRWGTRESFVRS